MSSKALCLGFAVGLLGSTIETVAQAPRPPSPALPGPADAAFEAARAAFERLPEADRRALQDALVWTGDYPSTTTGEFGRRTFEGIETYQRRTRQPPTGILDPPARRALLAAGEKARAAAGFATVADAATGIAIGVPATLLPRRASNPNGGSRFQSADGKVTLDTRALPGDADDLKELFERTARDLPGRTVTYRLLRPDFFVVTGDTATGRSYTRYALGPAGLRGFSIGYEKARAAELDRIVIAVGNSFAPFPSGPAAAGTTAVRPGQTGAPGSAGPGGSRPEQNVAASAGPGPEPATGLVVGPRRVVTTAEMEGCREVQVAGARARAVRTERGLTFLETAADRRGAALPFAAAPPRPEEALVVLFVASAEGSRPVATPAEAATAAGRLFGPLQPGAAGGLVLDRTGALVGLVAPLSRTPRAVAGLVPPASHGYLPASTLREALGPDAPPAATTSAERRSVGDIAALLAPAIVAIACGSPAGAPPAGGPPAGRAP